MCKDRKQERKTEKLENWERDAIRKKEESFRSDFMQAVATELARLGAPTMISWQKLMFDKECSSQAFRVLLTKIKSSRRSGNSSSSSTRRIGMSNSTTIRNRNNRPEDVNDDEEVIRDAGDDDRLADEGERTPPGKRGESRFPPLRASFVGKTRSGPPSKLDWNYDTTTKSPGRLDDDNNQEYEHGGDSTERYSNNRILRSSASSSAGGPEMIIERVREPGKPSGSSTFVAKFKKNQLQMVQHENAMLLEENLKLKDEIAHLEALNVVLHDENNKEKSAAGGGSFDYRRMRLLQAQNMQLQRQISMLQDAIHTHQDAGSSLLGALQHWRDIIDAGRQEAKAAGASDQNDDQKSVKWMMAVPDKLMGELNRVEQQIHVASTALNATFESKLRMSSRSAAYVKSLSGASSILMNSIYSGTMGHLRSDKVKQLEEKLASVGKVLDEWTDQALKLDIPLISLPAKRESIASTSVNGIPELASMTRDLIFELGAFGVVVPPSSVANIKAREGITTALDVVKVISSSTFASTAKEREKQAKIMLKQLHAYHTAMENEMKACRRETTYWKSGWLRQEEILCKLMKRVLHLGEKKLQWIDENVVKPMQDVEQVFASFLRAHVENTTRHNPFLPLLVETLTNQQPLILGGIEQCKTYSSMIQSELEELCTDYEANRQVLASSSSTCASD